MPGAWRTEGAGCAATVGSDAKRAWTLRTQRLLSILSRLAAITRWIGKKADLFADEAVKKAGMVFGGTAGLGVGAWLVNQIPALQAILKTAAEWLQPLLPLL